MNDNTTAIPTPRTCAVHYPGTGNGTCLRCGQTLTQFIPHFPRKP